MKLYRTVLVIVLLISIATIGAYAFTSGQIGKDITENLLGEDDSESNQPVLHSGTQNRTRNINPDSNIRMINNTLKGVVTIYSENGDSLESQGSGFLYKDGYIMTNQHVVSESTKYLIRYKRGEWSGADLVGSDVHTDIAILEYNDKPDYARSLPMQINIPKRGQRVISLGSPSGLDNTVTTGIISGVERSVTIGTEFAIPDTIQTDTALNPGNSGGPLVNIQNGAVVGVNRATDGENIGYAVSSRIADSIGKSLIDNGVKRHSYIGVRTKQINPIIEEYERLDIKKGIIVKETLSGTPANSTFQTGNKTTDPDIIVGIGNENVTTNEDIASYLMRNTEPDETVQFRIYRNGEYITEEMELASRRKHTA